MKTALIIGIVFILLGGGYYWYTQYQAAQNSEYTQIPITVEQGDTGTTVATTSDNGTPGPSVIKEFTVNGRNFSFDPSLITVKKSDTVKITFRDTQGMHNFIIDEFNAKSKTIQGGQEDILEFVANKTGTFEYYCSIGSHRSMGMVGKLVVE